MVIQGLRNRPVVNIKNIICCLVESSRTVRLSPIVNAFWTQTYKDFLA